MTLSSESSSDSNDINALMREGISAAVRRDYHEAARCFHAVLALNDQLPVALFYLGQVLAQADDFENAALYYRRTLDLKPDHVDALNNLGVVLLKLGRAGEAEIHLRRVCEGKPLDGSLLHNLAAALRKQDKRAEAAGIYSRILTRRPDDINALQQLGMITEQSQAYDDAEQYYRRAVDLKPDNPRYRINLSQNLLMQNKPDQAAVVLKDVAAMGDDVGAVVKYATIIPVIFHDQEEIDFARKQLDDSLKKLDSRSDLHTDDPKKVYFANRFFLAYHGRNNCDLMRRIADMSVKRCPAIKFVSPNCLSGSRRRSGGKPSLAFISNHFTGHTIAKFMKGMIEQLSHELFHITVVSGSDYQNATSRAIAEAADRYLVLPPSLIESRRILSEQRFDLICYPDIGMDPMTWFLAMSRLAPVQCVMWGHPDTTGSPEIDYFITSNDLETEACRDHYTETPVLLNRLPTYYHRPVIRQDFMNKKREDFGLPADRRLYICPQALFKLHPDFDRIIAGILESDSNGSIVLIRTAAKHILVSLQQRWRSRMPKLVDRMIVLDPLPRSGFMALLTCCDVMLDPLHFGGGNTTYEALSLGIPIVTLPMAFMRTRVTYACYRKMAISDCIASDEQDYIDKAVQLACDTQRRYEVSTTILNRNHVLYEDTEAVRELESFFLSVCS